MQLNSGCFRCVFARANFHHGDTRFRRSDVVQWIVLLTSIFLAGCGCHQNDSNPKTASKSRKTVAKTQEHPDDGKLVTTVRFVEAGNASGIVFTYRNGEESENATLLESLGGGASLLDFDGDGWLDIFLTGGGDFEKPRKIIGRDSALFRNLGDGRFEKNSQEAGIAFAPHYSHGSAVADFDHDGLPDVLVTGYGGLVFFSNMGDGTFVESTHSAGLTDHLWSSSAAWGDLNGDGHLDLYIAHYADWSWDNHPFCKGPKGKREICPPRRFQPLPDTVYLNQGDGTFRDASRDVGLSKVGKGLGVVIADVNLDGLADVYVGNDEVPNFLYRNLGNGKLKDVAEESGTSRGETGIAEGSMGVDVGDYNNDGIPDIFVANFEREAFGLYRNDGGMNFTHVSQGTGITALGGLYVGWGSVFFDFDCDGDEDIFVISGHVIRYPTNAPLKQKAILLENREGKRFVNVASAAGDYFHQDSMGRGVALGDCDNDGDQDLIVVRTNQPVSLLTNETNTENGWLSVRLIGRASSRQPIGAVVFLETTSGHQMRQVKGGSSYASTSDPRLHFGLGKANIRRLEIRWPSGRKQIIDNLAPNQFHTIIEPQ